MLELSKREKIMAPLMLVPAYIYYSWICESGITASVLLGIFTLLFLAYGEVMFRERRRTGESVLFFALTILIGVSDCFGIGQVWGAFEKGLFLHLFAVYWVLLRADCLAEGETSHLFAWDGINGFCKMPFSNFILGAKTVGATVFHGKKKSWKVMGISVVAILGGFVLFAFALIFLKEADANFAALMNRFQIQWNVEYIWRVIGSVFIACYLYGLMGGCFRTGKDRIQASGEKICSFISRMRQVPNAVWIAFIALFSVIYVLFFALQGSYMLDAFAMLLPEKYTFSEYARKGFGDMCAVMLVNFVLMWLTCRTSQKKTKLLQIFGTILMAESLIFALIAFLKLFLYIQAYGFTPLRLQSVWLVLVLSYACICILISMFTGKKTAKYWFDGSALTLALLTLV